MKEKADEQKDCLAISHTLVYTTLMDSDRRSTEDVRYRKTYKTADRSEIFKCG